MSWRLAFMDTKSNGEGRREEEAGLLPRRPVPKVSRHLSRTQGGSDVQVVCPIFHPQRPDWQRAIGLREHAGNGGFDEAEIPKAISFAPDRALRAALGFADTKREGSRSASHCGRRMTPLHRPSPPSRTGIRTLSFSSTLASCSARLRVALSRPF